MRTHYWTPVVGLNRLVAGDLYSIAPGREGALRPYSRNGRTAFTSDPEAVNRRSLRNGTTLINFTGICEKYFNVADLCGFLSEAAADDEVKRVVIRFDSPGGEIASVADAADQIFKLRQKKEILAYIEDIGACAAYVLASQATKVYANRSALVGGIGVFTTMADRSEQFKKAGVKVHVFRTGEHKGVGVPGRPIEPEHIEAAQKTIDDIGAILVSIVARGRHAGLPVAQNWADGRLHIAAEGVSLKLLDGITTETELGIA